MLEVIIVEIVSFKIGDRFQLTEPGNWEWQVR